MATRNVNRREFAAMFTVTTAAGFFPSQLVSAQPTGNPLPVEDFARRPTLRRTTFSPDGKKVSATAESKGRLQLVVADLEAGVTRQITNFERFDVQGYRWISNKRLILRTYDYKAGRADTRDAGFSDYAIDFDGKDAKRLAPWEEQSRVSWNDSGRTFFFFVGTVAGSEDEIYANSPLKGWKSPELVRLNTRTGKYTRLTLENPGFVGSWVLDAKGFPRAAVGRSEDYKEQIFWYRDEPDGKWRALQRSAAFGRQTWPIQFGPDGTLFVLSNTETETAAVYKWDFAGNKLGEQLFRHPRCDLTPIADPENSLGQVLSPLVLDPKSGEVIGLSVDGEKPETYWFDEKLAKVQKVMDASLDAGAINFIRKLDEGRYFVRSSSDRDPGASYIFDENKKQLKELVRPYNWIKPQTQSETKVLRFKARDGLEVPAYLTLPIGKDPKKLPLIAWIHGGPQARDEWGWSPEVQFMASRGYAVLQPNYRGSTGFGYKHQMAGAKQWGQAMQDDVTDCIKALIADGTADAARIAIGGASYGGYATMAGLVREPDLFKCGINVVGVTDLKWMHEIAYSDFLGGGGPFVDTRGIELFLNTMLGSLDTDRAILEANSPRLNAAKIKAPVLIIHGGGDERVPIKHAEGMRDALKAAGKSYEWLVFPEEGHGWNKYENWVTYLKAIETFLGKHMPA